jgi:mannose-6-phosphate isomerase-like protein (cupin superfamily)
VERFNLSDMTSFTTADGSAIRELAGRLPDTGPATHQSLAEATLEPGGETAEHLHPQAEEIYFFTSGTGRMRLGGEESVIGPGDCVVIPPGTPHKLFNTGQENLVLLCCCAPAYSNDDTVMTGG